MAVPDPGPLTKSLLTADLLIYSTDPIPDRVRDRVAAVHGVAAVMPLSMASVSTGGRTLTVAAVDPATYRRFTPLQSARADAVWGRVADGEIAVEPDFPKKLVDADGMLALGNQKAAPELHVGAYAPMVKHISAVVNYRRGAQLELPEHNALLVSTGVLTPSVLTGRIHRIVGREATLQTLATEFDVDVPQAAILSGQSVSAAVGSFTYTPHADGRVTPDPAWVSAHIRTESVPILGAVTCHAVMLRQLRSALTEVVERGLADSIHKGEYGGCYYPRYIAYDPAKGLSLHTWGIAIDLNVPGNQRGTVGEMDRDVVAIFKKWGFAWGGDWNYTDPMHFELAAIVS
jgi:hypothetical protein